MLKVCRYRSRLLLIGSCVLLQSLSLQLPLCAQTNSDNKTASDPASRVQPEPASKIQSEPVSRVQPEPASKLQSEPASRVQSDPDSDLQLEPESKSQSEPEPKVQLEPESELQSEPGSILQSEPQSSPESTTSPSSTSSTTASSIHVVDKALFLELIKLSRFNIRFHLDSNYHQKWRSFTYPLGREAGTGVSFGATITDISQQGENLNHPAGISRNVVKNSIACVITGNAISGTASSLELAQNAWVAWQAHKKGFSPNDSVAYVKARVKTIDALLDERERLGALETTPAKRRIRELETNLLRKIHLQLLFEFRTWSCHSRDQAWRENSFYAIDALQTFTRMTGAIIARRALQDPDLAGGSIICGLVANSIATINPIFDNFVARAVRRSWARKLEKEFPCNHPAVLAVASLSELRDLQQKHMATKEHTEGKHHEELLTEALLLSERSERLDLHLERENKDIDRYRQIAQQQTVSGPLIGLTGVAGSTLSTVAFFGHRDDPVTANKLGFSGRISNATGQAYALLNTPYTTIGGMLRNRRLRSRGELPSQILAQRLKNLDRFEAQVNAAKP